MPSTGKREMEEGEIGPESEREADMNILSVPHLQIFVNHSITVAHTKIKFSLLPPRCAKRHEKKR